MSTELSSVGEIEVENQTIYWTAFGWNPNTPRVISPKFRLPNCKDGNVDCHLFVDNTQKKIGIKNVSQDLGTVVISGKITFPLIIFLNNLVTGKEGN